MKQDEKLQIRDLLFKRVKDPVKRSKIAQLAAALSDAPDDDDYWAAIYHYALPENGDDLDEDYQRYVTDIPGGMYMPETEDVKETVNVEETDDDTE